MNSLVRSYLLLALLALIGLSCTTNTTITGPVLAPTIARFSPDTAWTFQQLKIYGTNFGYDGQDVLVTIDTLRVVYKIADDTVITVFVPENARTGLIHVRTYEQTATSAKPVTILQTFNPSRSFLDTLPAGAQFSIPGSGMNNYHGRLHISLNQLPLEVDSVFPDRIVSHVALNSYSGNLMVSDDSGSYPAGTLYVTRPSPWNILSQIWDRVQCVANHQRNGYINGLRVDSSWRDTVTYNRQIDLNIAGKLFIKTLRGVSYGLPPDSPYTATPLLTINWDSVSQSASATFNKSSVTQLSPHQSEVTSWYSYTTMSVSRPIGGDVEFVLANPSGNITKTASDTSGSLQETTSLQVISGSIDLILKR